MSPLPASLTESYERVLRVMAERDESGAKAGPAVEWPPPLGVAAQASYCVECDALPDACDHNAHRYLAPVTYNLVEGDAPQNWQWARSEGEQWRHANPMSTWPQSAKRTEEDEEPLPLQNLVTRLDDHLQLDNDLEDLLRDTYAQDPRKTSRLVLYVVDKCASRELRSPGGFLATRLKQFHRNR